MGPLFDVPCGRVQLAADSDRMWSVEAEVREDPLFSRKTEGLLRGREDP